MTKSKSSLEPYLKKNVDIAAGVGVIIVLSLLTLIVYKMNKNDETIMMKRTAPVQQESMMESNKITVYLAGEGEAAQTGTATLVEEDGTVKVTLNIAPTEGAQPAHIHVGSCPEPGKVLYSLTDVEDGKSETTINTTIAELDEQLPLAINVHKSAEEMSMYTSCGDLKE